MRSRFLSSNLFRWNKTLREDCSLLFYGWYSAGLRDIFWDSNSTFKYHSFETMMLKWNETRLLDLSCLEFTGPTLKLLASGRRSNVKFKPWMVKWTLVLKCQKQSVNCYFFFFFFRLRLYSSKRFQHPIWSRRCSPSWLISKLKQKKLPSQQALDAP